MTEDVRKRAYQLYHHGPGDGLNAISHIAHQVHGTIGVSSGSDNLDRVVIPPRAPWIRVWLAAPGMGKSTQLRVIALREARRLMSSEREEDKGKYVAFLTWEEDVGSQELHLVPGLPFSKLDFWHGKVDPVTVMAAVADRINIPIHMFGLSMYKEAMNKHRGAVSPMTIKDCINAMHYLNQTHDKRPSVIIVDYIQEVFTGREAVDDRTLQIIEATKAVEQMATVMGCAVELGAQAKQTTLDRKDPMPTLNDVEWSFYPTQKATMSVGLIRPWNISTMRNDDKLRKGGIPIVRDGMPEYMAAFTPDLVVAKPLKHRPGVLYGPVPFRIMMDTMTIQDFRDFYI